MAGAVSKFDVPFSTVVESDNKEERIGKLISFLQKNCPDAEVFWNAFARALTIDGHGKTKMEQLKSYIWTDVIMYINSVRLIGISCNEVLVAWFLEQKIVFNAVLYDVDIYGLEKEVEKLRQFGTFKAKVVKFDACYGGVNGNHYLMKVDSRCQVLFGLM